MDNYRQKSLIDSYRLDPNDPTIFNPPENNKRKIALAIILLAIGSVLLTVGLVEYFKATPGGIPMICIGSFAFLPGFYFTRIAYKAYRREAGFNMSDIPDV